MSQKETSQLEEAQQAIDRLPVEQRKRLSDWYHTFKQLYDMRNALVVAIVNTYYWANGETGIFTKSYIHNDLTMYPWYFIVQGEIPTTKKVWPQQISFHLPVDLRDKVNAKEVAKGMPWNWHTEEDVIALLLKLT